MPALPLAQSIRDRALSWWHAAPMAAHGDCSTQPQPWHIYDEAIHQWRAVPASKQHPSETANNDPNSDRHLSLVTWNVDAAADAADARIAAILEHVLSENPPDVLFLQEVNRVALTQILADDRIRRAWLSSEADDTNWGRQKFASMMLLSRSRFRHTNGDLGTLWRTKYPSRFKRDALCCDMFLPTHVGPGTGRGSRLRLINVHLDSLPIRPSKRPRQIAVVASSLRVVGRGLVAGDSNPVLPDDDDLIRSNDLSNAWLELHPGDPGYTWGADGEQPFPANRLDKITTVGLLPSAAHILPPGIVDAFGTQPQGLVSLPWSDHSGLKCYFAI